jgi:hypothetical protein
MQSLSADLLSRGTKHNTLTMRLANLSTDQPQSRSHDLGKALNTLTIS